MYKNKHVIVALLVAPILAILSYFAVDAVVSEKPQVAAVGQSYPLAEKSNCRYTSGVCGLKNGDFEVRIEPYLQDSNTVMLKIISANPLQGGRIALALKGDTGESINKQSSQTLAPIDDSGLEWNVEFDSMADAEGLQLVFSANDVIYFGEASLTFLDYKTTFGEDFRH